MRLNIDLMGLERKGVVVKYREILVMKIGIIILILKDFGVLCFFYFN